MTDAELDALDAFLAEKVMGYAYALADIGHGPYRCYGRKPGSGKCFSPTRDAADAEEVREKWLRDMPYRRTQAVSHVKTGFMADAEEQKPADNRRAFDEAPTLRLAELLAIARACGWEP